MPVMLLDDRPAAIESGSAEAAATEASLDASSRPNGFSHRGAERRRSRLARTAGHSSSTTL
jgi:hypothetical protein